MNEEDASDQHDERGIDNYLAEQQEPDTLAVPMAHDGLPSSGVDDFRVDAITSPQLVMSSLSPLTASPVAIFKLPADIWIRIVEHLTLVSPNLPALERTVLALSATSSHMRELCLHTPQLWSTLNINGSSHPGIVSAFLTRSGAAPIHVEISCSGPSNVIRNELIPHFNHARTLLVFIGSGSVDPWEFVAKLIQEPAPLLRWLSIQDTTGSSRDLPVSPETHWLQLRTLSLRGVTLDESMQYPVLRRITRLQYTEPGDRLTQPHLTWILGQCTSLEQFGTYADAGAWDFTGEPVEAIEPPISLRLVQFGDVYGNELVNVLSFFSRVPTIRARPEDVSRYNVLAAYPRIPLEPWSYLQQVNCRGRRGIAEYRTRASRIGGDTETPANCLQLYIRRDEMVKMLQQRPSADSLSLLTLDEGAWDFFANQSRCSRENPLVLPGLTTMRLTLMACVYEKFYYPDIYGSCGVWPNPDVFSLFDLPGLEELHLVHMTSWTCQRVRYQRSLKICQCHNNGIVSVAQVVDLLKHRQHGLERRIPKLALFGVTDVLDEDPGRNSAALSQLIDSVEWSWSVPNAFVEEDAQISDFHNQLVRGWFEPDVDSIRFS